MDPEMTLRGSPKIRERSGHHPIVFTSTLLNDESMENINNEPQDNNDDNHSTDEFDAETFADEEVLANDVPPAPTFTPPVGAMAGDRLVRDPSATFGGVLSGIAHRYGWDVSLTRLAYVALTFVTAGTTIPIYLLAWLIVPRANYWPPVVRRRTRSLTSRDMGFAVIGLGVFIALAIGTGQAAGIIVPLAMIASGVWLLTQSSREEVAIAGAGNTAAFASTDFAGSAGAGSNTTPPPPWTTSEMPTNAPEPVAPRSRKRRFAVIALIAGFVVLPIVALIFGVIIFFAAINPEAIDIEFDETARVTPTSIEEIPTNVTTAGSDDDGKYVLDLSNVDFSSVEPGDDPVRVDIDLDAGGILVIVHDEVRVDVDTDIGFLGSSRVFNTEDSGFGASTTVTVDDPQLDLDLQLDLGEIAVVRAE